MGDTFIVVDQTNPAETTDDYISTDILLASQGMTVEMGKTITIEE